MTQGSVSPSNPSGGEKLPINRKAIYSLILGFSAFLVLWAFPFGAFVLGVPAVTAGIHGRREISLGRGTERGDTLAVAGITAGAMTLVLLVVAIVLSV
ncbi:MAG: DUF4190 domain-containing protein [Aeromicrobium sp.]